MKFNRAIHCIKALSFDLDDTLYDNRPVIQAAVDAQMAYLDNLEKWHGLGTSFWLECRELAARQQPDLHNDMTRWRLAALELGLTKVGYAEEQARYHSEQAFAAFVEQRSRIQVSEEVLTLLHALGKRFPLIAITNGNVDTERFNLKGQFAFVLQAGPDGPAKPHPEMFFEAARRLSIDEAELLHIGDSLDSDIQGANNAGCTSVWLKNDFTKSRYRGLADIEIDNILELNVLARR